MTPCKGTLAHVQSAKVVRRPSYRYLGNNCPLLLCSLRRFPLLQQAFHPRKMQSKMASLTTMTMTTESFASNLTIHSVHHRTAYSKCEKGMRREGRRFFSDVRHDLLDLAEYVHMLQPYMHVPHMYTCTQPCISSRPHIRNLSMGDCR